jgi:hypothetical protein
LLALQAKPWRTRFAGVLEWSSPGFIRGNGVHDLEKSVSLLRIHRHGELFAIAGLAVVAMRAHQGERQG